MTFRRWYKDRDFPEIKASNADVLLPFELVHQERAEALMTEHNEAVEEIFNQAEEIESLKRSVSRNGERAAQYHDQVEKLKTRVEGMVLSLQKHGQNIDVAFHINWLEEALK